MPRPLFVPLESPTAQKDLKLAARSIARHMHMIGLPLAAPAYFALGLEGMSLEVRPAPDGILLTNGLLCVEDFTPLTSHAPVLLPLWRICSLKSFARSVEEVLLDAVEEVYKPD